ncbi:MAG: hypothetical protein KIT25_22735 [Enhydrobacter sp.]|nr:MAG: hypothetical protein KIT25_22735 [Enhydrobacter sp.]
MPLSWTISHPDRLISVTAKGFVSLQELEAYYDAVVVANALSYGRLFDVTEVGPEAATEQDYLMFGARMQAYASVMEFGPIAFVVTKPAVHDLVMRCLNLAPAPRPVRLFDSAEKAQAWLDDQCPPQQAAASG